MSITIVTKRDVIRSVPKAFRTQYGRNPGEVAAWSKSQKTKGELVNAADALDVETCTAEEMDAAIETKWCGHKCDECDLEKDALVRIGQEPDYEARWVDICSDCLALAADRLDKSQ